MLEDSQECRESGLCPPFPGGMSHSHLFTSENQSAGKLAVADSTLPCYQNVVQDSEVLSQNAFRCKKEKENVEYVGCNILVVSRDSYK